MNFNQTVDAVDPNEVTEQLTEEQIALIEEEKEEPIYFTTRPEVTVVIKNAKEGCAHKGESCTCPKYLQATGEKGQFQRFSAKTNSRKLADLRAKEYAERYDPKNVMARNEARKRRILPVKIGFAFDVLITKKKSGSNRGKHSAMKHLLVGEDGNGGFVAEYNKRNPNQKVLYVRDITLSFLDDFQETWVGRIYKDAPLPEGGKSRPCTSTAKQKKATLSHFLNFCIERQWFPRSEINTVSENGRTYQNNAARGLKVSGVDPQINHQPFTERLVKAIFEACGRYDVALHTHQRNKVRVTGEQMLLLCQLMVQTGFAIVDAYTLRRDALANNNFIEIHRRKTGKHVKAAITPDLAERLRKFGDPDAQFFFWNGVGEVNDAVANNNMHFKFKRLWKLVPKELWKSDLKGTPAPHCFRNTKAKRMFLQGRSVPVVARALGDTPRVIQDYYSKMCAEIEKQVEDANLATLNDSSLEKIGEIEVLERMVGVSD